jgi:type IV pilus assembly protein PilO
MAFKFNLKNSKLRYPLLISIIGIAGTALWYSSVYEEKNVLNKKLKLELSGKQNELNSILALKPQLNRIEAEIAMAQHRLDSLKSIFPDRKEIPKLIREITGIARATGIITVKFAPGTDIEKEYYIESHYDLSITGGYHDLARFFSFLANMPLIINVGNVSIRANPRMEELKKVSEERGSPISTINASFTMTTFSSKR